jgi:hypothetical protein
LIITSAGLNNIQVHKAGLGKIRSGDIFSIKIIESQDGFLKASIKGKILTIKSTRYFEDGKTLRVKAEWSGKTLLLKTVTGKEMLKNFIAGAGIKPDEAAVTLFQAARSGSLVLKDENIRLLERFLKYRKDLSNEEARTAVEFIKKGIYPEGISDLFNGEGFQEDRRKEDSALLFNHLQDSRDLWFVIPYNFKKMSSEGGADGLTGSIRYQKNLDNGKIEKVILDIITFSNRYFFMIESFSLQKRKLHIFTEKEISSRQKKAILNELPEILSNLPAEIDDNIRENYTADTEFDGFSFNDEPAGGIEEFV